MKRGLVAVLGIGIGWVVGVNVAMVTTALIGSDASMVRFADVFVNLLVYSFPGLVLFIISIILSLRDDLKNPYEEQFSF